MSAQTIAQVYGMPGRPVQVIAVTSGKGGVGKTNVSINLATALAHRGRSVMLMDADLGLANVDVLLGLAHQYNLMDVLSGTCTIEDIIIKGPAGIMIVPSASGVHKMAELSVEQHATLIHAFSQLNQRVDTLIVDTASGIGRGVMTYGEAATNVLVVVCDEPASLADAYGLIKVLRRERGVRKFHVLTNRVSSHNQGAALFTKLLRTTHQFLDVSLDHAGWIPDDQFVNKAAMRQVPLVEAFPRCGAATALVKLAEHVNDWPIPPTGGHVCFFLERVFSMNSAATANA